MTWQGPAVISMGQFMVWIDRCFEIVQDGINLFSFNNYKRTKNFDDGLGLAACAIDCVNWAGSLYRRIASLFIAHPHLKMFDKQLQGTRIAHTDTDFRKVDGTLPSVFHGGQSLQRQTSFPIEDARHIRQ